MQILITKVDLQYSSWISILGRSIKLISELICYPLVPTCGGGGRSGFSLRYAGPDPAGVWAGLSRVYVGRRRGERTDSLVWYLLQDTLEIQPVLHCYVTDTVIHKSLNTWYMMVQSAFILILPLIHTGLEHLIFYYCFFIFLNTKYKLLRNSPNFIQFKQI